MPEAVGRLPSCFLCFEWSGVVAFCLELACRFGSSDLVGVLPHVGDMSLIQLLVLLGLSGRRLSQGLLLCAHEGLGGWPCCLPTPATLAPSWFKHVPAPRPLHCSSLPVFLFLKHFSFYERFYRNREIV